MTLIALIFFQLVWAGTYIAMKVAMSEMPLGLVMIFRYGFGFLFFLLAGQLSFKNRFRPKEWGIIIGIGLLTFSLSPYFQLKSLTLTYATDVAVMIAFEPLVVAILAYLILKEELTWRAFITFLVATLGVLVMSSGEKVEGVLNWGRLLGNGIFFCSILCEAMYSITSRHLVQKHHPLRLTTWMILAGFLGNLLGNYSLLTEANLSQITIKGWSMLFYLSFLASFVCYGGWVVILKRLPVTQISLSLFLQPIIGTIYAVILLGEDFTWRSFVGSSLIVTALLIWIWKHLHQKRIQVLGALRRSTGMST